jgi:hypothetical protein
MARLQNIRIAEFRLGNYLVVIGEVGPRSEEKDKQAKKGAEQKTPSESPESFAAQFSPQPTGVIGRGTGGESGAAAVSVTKAGGVTKTTVVKKSGESDADFSKRQEEERTKQRDEETKARDKAKAEGKEYEEEDISSGENLSIAHPWEIQPSLDPIFVMFEDGKTSYKRGASLQESKIEPEPSEAVKYCALYGLFVMEQTDQSLTYDARKQFERERILPSEQNALQYRARERELAIRRELEARGIKGEELETLKSKPEPYPNPHVVQKATEAQKARFGDKVEEGARSQDQSQGPTSSQTIAPGTEQPIHSPAREVTKTPEPGETKIGTQTPSTAHSVPSGEKAEPTGPNTPKK